jgi:tRNA threonylcarbamoyladenosine biosynthesis protein TsaB
MRILAIDSAAGSVSAAVLEDERLLAEGTSNAGRNASVDLLPMAAFVLRAAGIRIGDVDLIACTDGPGSFTGLRIGVATVKGLALATGKPLIGVSSLRALACNPARPGMTICSMIDARRSQVYAALFETDGRGSLRQLRPDGLADVADYAGGLGGGGVVFVGSGAARYTEEIRRVLGSAASIASDHHHLIRAAAVGRLGWKDYRESGPSDPVRFLPRYLRISDAERKGSSLER